MTPTYEDSIPFPKRKPSVSPKGRKDKGSRLERHVAKSLGGKRTPLSGATGGGDVTGTEWSIECKARATLPALLRDAFKQAEKDIAIGDPRKALVVIKADHEEPVYCVKESAWLQMRSNRGPENTFVIKELARAIGKLAVEIEGKTR